MVYLFRPSHVRSVAVSGWVYINAWSTATSYQSIMDIAQASSCGCVRRRVPTIAPPGELPFLHDRCHRLTNLPFLSSAARRDLAGVSVSPWPHYLIGARGVGALGAAIVHTLPHVWWQPTQTTVFTLGGWSLVTVTWPGGSSYTGTTTGTVTLYAGSTVVSTYAISATAATTLPSGASLAIRLGNIPGFNVNGFDGRCLASVLLRLPEHERTRRGRLSVRIPLLLLLTLPAQFIDRLRLFFDFRQTGEL